MSARDSVRAGMTARRAFLAAAALMGGSNMGGMLWLSKGVPAAELGRLGWLASPLRAIWPLLGLAFAASLAALLRRRTRAWGAAAAFGLLLLCDLAANSGDHGTIFTMAGLMTYALVGFLCGTSDAGERTAWDACCAVIGVSFALAGFSKLRFTGLHWASADYMQVLCMAATSQARGALHALRLLLAESPRLAQFGGVYVLIVELLGPLMLSRRRRPYYLAAALLVHAGFYLGMGILWQSHLLFLLAAAFPFEATFLRLARGRKAYAGLRA